MIFKLPVIPLKEKGICEYCGNEVGVGDYFLTNNNNNNKYMCCSCYKGRTIFPVAVIESDYKYPENYFDIGIDWC